VSERSDSYTTTLRIVGMVVFAVACVFLGRWLFRPSGGAPGQALEQPLERPLQ
jgi:hypothetical protein